MKYNDVLAKMPEVVRKLNTKDNPDYKLPESFKIITEMLKIESVCNEYYIRINELTKEESDTFLSLSKFHTQTRNALIEEYERLFMIGIINNNDFLENYNNWSDYVIAFILIELKDKFLSPEFNEVFNEEVGVKALSSDSELLRFYKNRKEPTLYQKLMSKPEDLNHTFKACLKEFEISSKIFEKNGLIGLHRYIQFLSCVNQTHSLSKLIEKNIEQNIINDRYSKSTKKYNHINLIDIYLELEKSELWFSNHNLSLMINLTSENSVVEKLIQSEKYACALGAFMNNLCNNSFYNLVVSNESGFPEFKDVSNLVNILLKNPLQINYGAISANQLVNVMDNIDEVINGAIDGEFEVGKPGYGFK